MLFEKPYPQDYRRPVDAEEILKKIPKMSKHTVLGFFDESSPQTTANTQRVWYFTKKPIIKNTSKFKANIVFNITILKI
jgi:hypothetical protein